MVLETIKSANCENIREYSLPNAIIIYDCFKTKNFVRLLHYKNLYIHKNYRSTNTIYWCTSYNIIT